MRRYSMRIASMFYAIRPNYYHLRATDKVSWTRSGAAETFPPFRTMRMGQIFSSSQKVYSKVEVHINYAQMTIDLTNSYLAKLFTQRVRWTYPRVARQPHPFDAFSVWMRTECVICIPPEELCVLGVYFDVIELDWLRTRINRRKLPGADERVYDGGQEIALAVAATITTRTTAPFDSFSAVISMML